MTLEVTNQFVLCVESFDTSWMDTLELPSRSVTAAMDNKVILSPEGGITSWFGTLEGTLFDRHTVLVDGS